MSKFISRGALVMQNLSSAFHSLLANRMRSTLTTVGIVIGISTMTAIAGLLQGFNSQVMDALGSLGASSVYIQNTDGPEMAGPPRTGSENMPDLQISYSDQLGEIPGVLAVVPTSETMVRLKTTDGLNQSCVVMGTSDKWLDVGHRNLADGRFFTEWEVSSRRYVCVVGSEISERVFDNRSPIGEEIDVQGSSLLIVGSLESYGEVMGESQDDIILVPYTIFHRWDNLQESLKLIVELSDPAEMESMLPVIESNMRMLRGLSIDDSNDFAIVTSESLQESFSTTTELIFVCMVGLSGLALLVGSIGIANIMLVSVTQRTREIGLRKSLGATRSQILTQFLSESVILSLVGGILGIFIGAAASNLASRITGIPTEIQLWIVLVAVLVSALSGITAGFIPAARAARLEPFKALGHRF